MAEESQKLAHEIWLNEKQTSSYKVAFAYKLDLDRHAELSSTLSENGLKICSADSFPTSDGYSLDVFLVEGLLGKDLEEFSNLLKFAIAETEEAIILSNLEFDLGLIAIGEQISSGPANLHRGTYQAQEIVVKELINNETLLVPETFWKGMQILSGLGHPNVVRCLGANTKGTLKIVTEYMPGGNLFNNLQNKHGVLTFSQRLKLAIDVSKGIEYLHEKMVIHKNLNPSNLLLDRDDVVKVDIASALFMNWAGMVTAPKSKDVILDLPGTNTPQTRTWCRWTAPEAMNEGRYGDRSDVYSFGMILWHLLTAKVPYEELDRRTPRHTLLRVIGGQRPDIPAETNPELEKIIDKCLDSDPSYRPHISEARSRLESLLSEINTPAAPTRLPAPTISPSNQFDCLPDTE